MSTQVVGESRDSGALPSYDEFYEVELVRLRAVAYALCGSWHVAEEIAQDALAAAHRKWEVVGRLDRPGAWARRVVLNRSATRFRRAQAEARSLLRLGTRPGVTEAVSPDAVAVWNEVRRLPRRQAQVVTLVYVEGYPLADAAAVLGIGVETAKTHLKRARATLARRLQEDDDD